MAGDWKRDHRFRVLMAEAKAAAPTLKHTAVLEVVARKLGYRTYAAYQAQARSEAHGGAGHG